MKMRYDENVIVPAPRKVALTTCSLWEIGPQVTSKRASQKNTPMDFSTGAAPHITAQCFQFGTRTACEGGSGIYASPARGEFADCNSFRYNITVNSYVTAPCCFVRPDTKRKSIVSGLFIFTTIFSQSQARQERSPIICFTAFLFSILSTLVAFPYYNKITSFATFLRKIVYNFSMAFAFTFGCCV